MPAGADAYASATPRARGKRGPPRPKKRHAKFPPPEQPAAREAGTAAAWPQPNDETEAFCEFVPVPEEVDAPQAFEGWEDMGMDQVALEDGEADYDKLDGDSIIDDTPLTSEASEAEEDEDFGPLLVTTGIGTRRSERKAASKMLWSGARVVPEDDSHIF